MDVNFKPRMMPMGTDVFAAKMRRRRRELAVRRGVGEDFGGDFEEGSLGELCQILVGLVVFQYAHEFGNSGAGLGAEVSETFNGMKAGSLGGVVEQVCECWYYQVRFDGQASEYGGRSLTVAAVRVPQFFEENRESWSRIGAKFRQCEGCVEGNPVVLVGEGIHKGWNPRGADGGKGKACGKSDKIVGAGEQRCEGGNGGRGCGAENPQPVPSLIGEHWVVRGDPCGQAGKSVCANGADRGFCFAFGWTGFLGIAVSVDPSTKCFSAMPRLASAPLREESGGCDGYQEEQVLHVQRLGAHRRKLT